MEVITAYYAVPCTSHKTAANIASHAFLEGKLRHRSIMLPKKNHTQEFEEGKNFFTDPNLNGFKPEGTSRWA